MVKSKVHGPQSYSQVKRWSLDVKDIINIQPTKFITFYYNRMAVVDSLDSYVGCYRIHVRRKIWYWSLYTNTIVILKIKNISSK